MAKYGATCHASSSHPADIYYNYTCENAIDGKTSTDWMTNGGSYAPIHSWIEIQLPKAYDISYILFIQRNVEKVREVAIYFNNDEVHACIVC